MGLFIKQFWKFLPRSKTRLRYDISGTCYRSLRPNNGPNRNPGEENEKRKNGPIVLLPLFEYENELRFFFYKWKERRYRSYMREYYSYKWQRLTVFGKPCRLRFPFYLENPFLIKAGSGQMNLAAIQNIGPPPPRSQIMEREFFP